MKRIAFINNNFPALSATFIYNEVIELRKKGINIKTYSVWKPEYNQVSDECHDLIDSTEYLIPIDYVKLLKAILYYSIFRSYKLASITMFLITRSYKNVFKDRYRTLIHVVEGLYLAYLVRMDSNIKHIHAHYASHPATIAYVVSELNNITFSFTAHASDIWIEKLLLNTKIKSAKFVITCTKYGKRQIIENTVNVGEDAIFTVYHGVNLAKYNGIPKQINTNKDRIRLLTVGRLSEEKSQTTVIDICKSLYRNGVKFECWIVGDGPLYDDLKKLIFDFSLQNHVFLKGKIKQEDIVNVYRESDIFLLTSVRENLPNVLLESMAMGVPIVASNIAGIPELIKNNENGFLVQPKDIKEYIKCIEKLIKDPKLYYNISRNGIDTVRNNFNMANSIEQISDIYRNQNIL